MLMVTMGQREGRIVLKLDLKYRRLFFLFSEYVWGSLYTRFEYFGSSCASPLSLARYYSTAKLLGEKTSVCLSSSDECSVEPPQSIHVSDLESRRKIDQKLLRSFPTRALSNHHKM